MITRRIPAARRAGGLAGLVRYLAGRDGERGEIRLTNLVSPDLPGAVMEMQLTQAANVRATADRTYHLVVAFDGRDRERLSGKVLETAERELVETLGLGQHERVSIVHQDTAFTHLHVVVNLIHPVTHRKANPWRDQSKLAAMTADLQERFGLERTNQGLGPRLDRSLGGRIRQAEERSGERSFASWVRERVELPESGGWSAVHDALARTGVALRAAPRGLVLEARGADGRQYAAPAYRVFGGRAELERRYGPFVELDQRSRRRCEYEPSPLSGHHLDLHREYRRLAEILERDRRARMRRAREARDVALREVEQKRATGSLASGEARDEKHRIGVECTATLREIIQSTPKRTWIQFVQAEARRGRPDALDAMRWYSGDRNEPEIERRRRQHAGAAGWKVPAPIRALLANAETRRSEASAGREHAVRVLSQRGVDRTQTGRDGVLPDTVSRDMDR